MPTGKNAVLSILVLAVIVTPLRAKSVSTLARQCGFWGMANSCHELGKLADQCNSQAKPSFCRELARVAVEDNDATSRLAIVRVLTDQALLGRIAQEDANARVRSMAVANLTDRSRLARTALEAKDAAVRQAAVEKLTDQPVLAEIAVDDPDVDVRYAAAGRIQDGNQLNEIARHANNGRTQVSRILLLRTLLADSGVLDQPVWIAFKVNHTTQNYIEHSGTTKMVYGESVDISLKSSSGTILAHKFWSANLPYELPAGTAETRADLDLTDLVVGLCQSQHYSAAQIEQALIRIAARNSNWTDAIRRLRGEVQGTYPTALHWAVDMGDEEMAALLLANGAYVNARDQTGRTPLKAALSSGRVGMAELLRQHGGHE